MKKLALGLVVLGLLISACNPPAPLGIGVTGGVVTSPNNSAALTIPAGTFTAPVNIKLEPIVAPSVPLEYAALNGGSFQLTAPSEFSANQNATLEIEDNGLTTAFGKAISTQALPDGAIVVALAQRPDNNSYQMLEMKRSGSKWRVEIFKEYLCLACRILAAYFTPTRVEINLPDVPEGSSVQASLTLFNQYGSPLSSNFAIQLWSSDDPSIATVDANGLVKGIRVGQTKIQAKTGSLGNPFLAYKQVQVSAKPVVFTANYSAGTIKGYSRGQLASSGNPSPLVTLTLPNGTTPNDLEFDSSQNLWVSDNTGNRILRFTPAQYNSSGSPIPSVIISSNANNSIFQPVGLAFDSSNLWVANNTSLVRFAAANLGTSGTPSPDRTITGATVNFPGGIALDTNNNLWAAMFGTNKVQRWTPSEQSSSSVPGYTITPPQQPAGLTFDSSGNLYVGQIGSNSTSGVAVYSAAQLSTASPTPTRTLGLGATNQVYAVAFDPNIGGIWANNQANGALIGFSAAQLNISATTPAVTTSGATQSGGGYGGVATSSNSNPAVNTPPSINSFTATPNALAVGGGTVTFNWNVTGATSLSINQGIGTVTGSSTSRTVNSSTTFTLTATNSNGSLDSSPVTVTVNVLGRKLWHSSFRENLIRGYNEAKWGGANPATIPDTTLNLAACGGNIYPNDIIQDNAGNIIFTSPAQQKVVRVAAAVVAQNGVVNVEPAQCETIYSGIAEFIGLTLDTDGRSFFVGTQNGVRFLKYNAGTNSYNNQNLPVLNTNVAVSGVHLAANRLYAVEYVNFNAGTTTGKVRVYDLDANRINDATLRLTFQPNNNSFRLPEGISLAAGRLWIANNSGDNLMGFKLTDINATPINNQTQQLDFIAKNNTNVSSFIHCPGGIATAPNGELWVNAQGASAANANCGNFATALGNIYKYSIADLADASSPTAAPSLQFSSIVSVPGYGGLFFGK